MLDKLRKFFHIPFLGEADAAIRASEERYRLISSLSMDYVFSSTVHKDGNITHDWESGAFESISGYTPEEFRARGGWRATVHPDDLEIDERLLEKLRRNEKTVGELRVITKDGRTRWVREYIHPIWDERENRLAGIYGAVQDITERKEIDLREVQRRATLEKIVKLGKLVTEAADLKTTLTRIWHGVHDELGFDRVAIFLYDQETHSVHGTLGTDNNGNIVEEWEYLRPLSQGKPTSFIRALENPDGVYFTNNFAVEFDIPEGNEMYGVKDYASVTAWGGEKPVAIICVDNFPSKRSITQESLEALRLFAGYAGLAIENSRLNIELENRVIERTEQLLTEKARIERIAGEVATLRKLSDFLQSSMTIEEASGVVANHMKTLFANTNGGLYLIIDGFADLTLTSSWGDFETESVIQPDDCWGMRRGRVFVRHPFDASPVCAHFGESIPDESLCLPLMGQNEIIGMLCLQIAKRDNTYFTQDVQNLAVASADSIALALANLRLRERLRNQTIRDPLTGIFNRRYLEETLEREVHRAGRNDEPLCVIMFEIDNFKQYNNTFGHDAGDYVLKKIVDTMRSNLRRSDFPCRYGGDEFTLLLPNTTLEDGAHRAEELRKEVAALALSFNNQALGQVTVRLGVAAYPKHGETGEAVLKVADDASYRARANGKNCVVVAE